MGYWKANMLLKIWKYPGCSCANVFVFGDFNIYNQDWLTYSGGTDKPGELL